MFIASTTPVSNNGDEVIGQAHAERIDTLAGYVRTDQASSLYIEQTADGEHWDVSEEVELTADTTATFSVNLIAAQVRLRVANSSGSDQTYLRVYAKGTSAGDS